MHDFMTIVRALADENRVRALLALLDYSTQSLQFLTISAQVVISNMPCLLFYANRSIVVLLVICSCLYLGNFLRRLVLPKKIKHWSVRSLLVRFVKTGAKIVINDRYVTFQMAAVAIDKRLFAEILFRIERLHCNSV